MNPDTFEVEFPDLWTFLVGHLADPPDGFTEEELVHEFVSECPRVAIDRVLAQFDRLLAGKTIPWQLVAKEANRYLTSERHVRAWAEKIVGLIESGLGERD